MAFWHQHHAVPQYDSSLPGNVSQVSKPTQRRDYGARWHGLIFNLLDEKPETDNGMSRLSTAASLPTANLGMRGAPGVWAWKHPHGYGTTTHTRLAGDVRMFRWVDFAL